MSIPVIGTRNEGAIIFDRMRINLFYFANEDIPGNVEMQQIKILPI